MKAFALIGLLVFMAAATLGSALAPAPLPLEEITAFEVIGGDNATTTIHVQRPKKSGTVKIEVDVYDTDHKKIGKFRRTINVPESANASQKAGMIQQAIQAGIESTPSLHAALQSGSVGGSVTIAGTEGSSVGKVRVNTVDETAQPIKISTVTNEGQGAPPAPLSNGPAIDYTTARPSPAVGDGGWHEYGVVFLLLGEPTGRINGQDAWLVAGINHNPPGQPGWQVTLPIEVDMSRRDVALAMRDGFRSQNASSWISPNAKKVFVVLPGNPEITDVNYEFADDTLNAGHKYILHE